MFLLLATFPFCLPESISETASRAYLRLVEEGDDYLVAGSIEKALNVYNQAIELDPNQPLAFLRAGEFFYNIAFLRNANFYLLNAIKADPRTHRAQYLLAKLYLATGQFKESQAFMDKALEGQPDSWEYRSWLSRLRLEMGNAEEALRIADGVLEKAVADYEQNKAILASERSSLSKKIPDQFYYDDLLIADALNDGESDTLFFTEDVFDGNYSRDAFERASRAFAQSLQGLSELRFHKALALIRSGRRVDGLKAFGESMFEEESDLNKGMSQYFIGKYKEASQRLKYVGASSENSPAMLCRWLSCKRIGDEKSANKIFARLTRNSKDKKGAWLVPVLTYYKTLQPELDIQDIGEERKLSARDQSAVAFYKAQMNLLMGDEAGARSLLKQASVNVLIPSRENKAAQIQRLLFEVDASFGKE